MSTDGFSYFGAGVPTGQDSATDMNSSAVPVIEVEREDRYLALQVIIEATAGGAPSDTPIGGIELYCSGDGVEYSQVTSTKLTEELAKVAAIGNTRVSAWAILEGVPGRYCKLRYKRASGGGNASRVRCIVSV